MVSYDLAPYAVVMRTDFLVLGVVWRRLVQEN